MTPAVAVAMLAVGCLWTTTLVVLEARHDGRGRGHARGFAAAGALCLAGLVLLGFP